MKKANLSCPREMIFLNELLICRPGLPGNYDSKPGESYTIEVDILAVDGEQALVRLPNIMERETATINVAYLS